MITSCIQHARTILIAIPPIRYRGAVAETLRVRPTTHLREGRHGGILRVGVDEFGEGVGLGEVEAVVGPLGGRSAFPGGPCAQGGEGVSVGVLAGEGLGDVGVDGDFGVGGEGVAGLAVGQVGDGGGGEGGEGGGLVEEEGGGGEEEEGEGGHFSEHIEGGLLCLWIV